LEIRIKIEEKTMRFGHWAMSLLFAAAPVTSWGGVWSSCQTVTAVTDYMAHSNSVYLILSPGIAGCNSDAPGAAVLRVGEMGVSADSIKGLTAMSMIAFLSGKRVMIYYDNSSSACFSSIISVGGFSAQCP
jgi:hypothetical protein